MVSSIVGSIGSTFFIGAFVFVGCLFLLFVVKKARRRLDPKDPGRHISLQEHLQSQDQRVSQVVRQSRGSRR
jgi:hypothetical protein